MCLHHARLIFNQPQKAWCDITGGVEQTALSSKSQSLLSLMHSLRADHLSTAGYNLLRCKHLEADLSITGWQWSTVWNCHHSDVWIKGPCLGCLRVQRKEAKYLKSHPVLRPRPRPCWINRWCCVAGSVGENEQSCWCGIHWHLAIWSGIWQPLSLSLALSLSLMHTHTHANMVCILGWNYGCWHLTMVETRCLCVAERWRYPQSLIGAHAF